MPTVNETLLDRAIRHAVLIERLKIDQVRRHVGFLNADLFEDLVTKVRRLDRLQSRGARALSTRLYRSVLQELDRTTTIGMSQFNARLGSALEDIARSEAAWQRSILTRVLPTDVLADFGVVRPASAALVRAVVRSRPFQGLHLRDEISRMSRQTRLALRQQINQGMLQGEGIDVIVRRVRGTARNGFRDGVLQATRRDASRIVRTTVNHVSARAREEVYRDNPDLVREVMWVSVLDVRTSTICAGLDGAVFAVDKGPRPPQHPNCRSSTVPIVASWEDLGIKDPSTGTRASMTGEVPANVTYGEWLRGQPVRVQNEALGPSRARLFRSGTPIEQFHPHTNPKPLTLRELEALESV